MKSFFLLISILINCSFAFSTEIVMKHMPEGKTCIICHQANTHNQLLLRNGIKIDITKVDELCGQCHGIKHRRWLDGRHGKVTTSWKADSKKRLSCIVCHDPHSPKFKQMQSKEPPKLRHL
jgi:hypothetical protein